MNAQDEYCPVSQNPLFLKNYQKQDFYHHQRQIQTASPAIEISDAKYFRISAANMNQ